MKYAIVILDGAANEPLEALGWRTPLQAANLPAIDSLAACGRLGTAAVHRGGSLLGEAAAYLEALGYDSARYEAGEGSLIARARALKFEPEDQVFCCDLVTVVDGQLRDFTAGFIRPAEAEAIVRALNKLCSAEPFRFHSCKGYRNLCVWKQAGPLRKLRTAAPDRALNQAVRKYLPRGSGSKPLYTLTLRAQAFLSEHDVNIVRADLGENPANAIWLWGNGPFPTLPSFQHRFGVRGALVAKSDVVRGLGSAVGWEVLDIGDDAGVRPGSDYASEGRSATAALDSNDLVCVHAGGPHTFGLLGLAAESVSALEKVDQQIVAPLLERLRAEPDWRMLVLPARAMPAAAYTDSVGSARTLFVFAGRGIESNRGEVFDEENALAGEMHLDRTSDLMEYFLTR